MNEKLDVLKAMFTRFSTQFLLLDSVLLVLTKGKSARLYAAEVLVILGISAISALLYLLFLYDKDVSKKKMFIMQLSYFVIVDTIVTTAGYFLHWFSFQNIKSFIIFECIIIGLCAITILYSYKVDSNTARKISEKLKILKSEQEN